MKQFFVALLIFNLSTHALAQESCSKKAAELIAFIRNNHVQPAPPDSNFSKHFFLEFFRSLDPQMKLFSVDDLSTLLHYQSNVVEHLLSNNLSFIEASGQLMKSRITEYESWINAYLKNPVDFTREDELRVLYHLDQRTRSQAALLEHRQRLIKFEMLEYMYKQSKPGTGQESILKFEPDARTAVLAIEKGMIDRLRGPKSGFQKFLCESLLKSVARTFDPHTEYFAAVDADEFKASLSDQVPDFGFDLGENDRGEIMVDWVIPGGPAWNSNEIHKGDVLIGLKDPHGRTTEFSQYDVEEAIDLLKATDLKEAEIILRKPDGQVKGVELVKQVMEQSENVVKSFVLSGKHKIGYISLPGFYTQWENDNTRGCSADMAKELIKLNKEKIEGLILDLRFNHGGALHEALELAGIFIDTGPLVLYQNRKEPVIAIKDPHKGTIYDGPIVLMVNGFSASASELLAATLQDYNRALIVGTTTFGKGTGQEILPLSWSGASSSRSPADFVKVTSDRLYRITGKSYQHNGVVPDILMDDITVSVPQRERFYPNSLKADSVNKKTYYTPLPPLPREELKIRSYARQNTSVQLSHVKKLTNAVLKPVPLHASRFEKYKKEIDNLYQEYESLKSENKHFSASSTLFDSSLLKLDRYRQEQQLKFARQLEESIYINEAFQIMGDYISLKKK